MLNIIIDFVIMAEETEVGFEWCVHAWNSVRIFLIHSIQTHPADGAIKQRMYSRCNPGILH
jgi:hypothetical protein